VRLILQIKEYEKLETPEERLTKAREIYDHHIMVEMLAHSHVRFKRKITIYPFLELYKRFSSTRTTKSHEKHRASRSFSGIFLRVNKHQFLALCY
jgi:hypothetical protein